MVTSEYAPVQQAGNGVTVAFNFTFKILATTDLVVSKVDASGNSSGTLVLETDYTVAFDPIAETGTVTYTVAPVTGGYSLIERESNNQQQTSLPREGPMPAKTVETMLDKDMMLLQELAAAQTLAVQSPLFQSGLWVARPNAPTYAIYYYSTDRQSLDLWVPAAARWFLLG